MKSMSLEEASAILPSLAQMVIDGETVLVNTSKGEIVIVAKSRYSTGIDDYDSDEIELQNAICANVVPSPEM